MSPVRHQRSRRKGWTAPPGAVYVGRGTRWGNPVSVHTGLPAADARAQAVESFHAVLADPRARALGVYPDDDTIRAELGGKDLMCWCPPDQPCHADVLLSIANPKETDRDRVAPAP